MARGGQRGDGSAPWAISRRRSRSGVAAAGLCVSTLTLTLLASVGVANAVIFDNRAAFEATLGNFITDDYSSPGYAAGDITDVTSLDVHSNASMSAVLGETRYTSTSPDFPNNAILRPSPSGPGNPYYCTGCDGSFLLDFTATSVGDASGVFGVGMELVVNRGPYVAFVTFGDGGTANFTVPGAFAVRSGAFWGITDPRMIASIHFGGLDGAARNNGNFGIDDLTIGAQVLPEPSVILLFALGLVSFGLVLRRARPAGKPMTPRR